MRKAFLITILLLVEMSTINADELTSSNFDEIFKAGKVELKCEIPCALRWGWNRKDLRKLDSEGKWYELAKRTAELNQHDFLAFYYLVKAAFNLGYYEATLVYIENSFGTDRNCRFDSCEGIKIEEELIKFRQQILEIKSQQNLEGYPTGQAQIENQTSQNAPLKNSRVGLISDEFWREVLLSIDDQSEGDFKRSLTEKTEEMKGQVENAARSGDKVILRNQFFKFGIFALFLEKITDFDAQTHSQSIKFRNLLATKLKFSDSEIEREINNLISIAREIYFISESNKILLRHEKDQLKEVKSQEQRLISIKEAAENGNAVYQLELGQAYQLGLGNVLPQDDNLAATWIKKAAEQGNAEAQYELGGLYVSGKGVSKDEKLAEMWFKKSASQNNSDAENMLSVINENRVEKARERELEKLKIEREAILAKKKQEEEKAAAEKERARLEKQRNLEKLKSL